MRNLLIIVKDVEYLIRRFVGCGRILTLEFSLFSTIFFQLTDLCLVMLSKEISGRSSVMSPSIDSDDRMLVSLVLLTVTVLLHKRKEPLCRPFVDILDGNKDLKVEIHKLIYLTCW